MSIFLSNRKKLNQKELTTWTNLWKETDFCVGPRAEKIHRKMMYVCSILELNLPDVIIRGLSKSKFLAPNVSSEEASSEEFVIPSIACRWTNCWYCACCCYWCWATIAFRCSIVNPWSLERPEECIARAVSWLLISIFWFRYDRK